MSSQLSNFSPRLIETVRDAAVPMTGAPAETWRKFTFTSTPGWAYLFGALGAAAFSSRATGHLPLTREAAKRIALVRWVFVGLIPIAILFWIAAGIAAPSDQSDTTRGAVSGFLILFGIAAIFVAFVGVLLARSYFGPSARIIERLATIALRPRSR